MLLLSAGLGAMLPVAAQAATPKIRTSTQNAVPACVTPERLMAFLKKRNHDLAPRFAGIAEWYKRHGETWRVRWDYAFFQMAVETNFLTFKRGNGDWGDARPKQNNFAGLGTTGGGVPGDSFPDVGTGVLAQIQHLVVYSGERIAKPVGPRTRLKQDDILETMAPLKGRTTFGDLSRRWAADKHYGAAIEWVAGRFRRAYCNGRQAKAVEAKPQAKPLPKATALGGPAVANVKKVAVEKIAPVRTVWSREMQTAPPPPVMPERSPHVAAGERPNAPPASARAPNMAAAVRPMRSASAEPAPMPRGPKAFAFAGALNVALLTSSPAPQAVAASGACRVLTASYGGKKTLLVRATGTRGEVRYTALTVLAGFEHSMLDNYVKVHAPGGSSLGEFESRDAALAKAKELCPSAAQATQGLEARAG